MPVNSVLTPYPVFFDASGLPLENGFIYIGQPGFEARTTPKASFFDSAATIPSGTASGAAVRTRAGLPVNTSNAPAMIYVDGDFSISVCDRNGVLLYSALNQTLVIDQGGVLGPILAPDGTLGAVGIGFDAEPDTGFVRPALNTLQTAVGGVLVSQQTPAGTVFPQPVSGTGFVSGVAAALDPDLTALATNTGNGLWARTGDGTGAARTITAGTGVTVTNGNGVSGNPTIAVTGARVPIITKTASASANISFSEFDNATYRLYEFELENVKPATDSVTLLMRTSTNGGAAYDQGASDYAWGMNGTGSGGSQAGINNAASSIALTDPVALVGNAASEYGVSGRLTLFNAPSAVPAEVAGFINYWRDTSEFFRYSVGGCRFAAADVDAVRFLFTSGNIASGKIKMYGII